MPERAYDNHPVPAEAGGRGNDNAVRTQLYLLVFVLDF